MTKTLDPKNYLQFGKLIKSFGHQLKTLLLKLKIALYFLQSIYFLDFLASFPATFGSSGLSAFSLARLARIPTRRASERAYKYCTYFQINFTI